MSRIVQSKRKTPGQRVTWGLYLAEAQTAYLTSNSIQSNSISPSVSLAYLQIQFKTVQSNPLIATTNGIPNGILEFKENPWL